MLRFTERASACSYGSFCASAPCYGLSEHVRVAPVIVAELKFHDVQRQVLFADLVEAANDTALEDRPEALG
jgi:hypothetical protein